MGDKITERGIAMVAAVTECLRFKKVNDTDDESKILGNLLKFIKTSGFKKYEIDMVSAGSKATNMIIRNPSMTDREVISQILSEK
jgi:hypothetical protein